MKSVTIDTSDIDAIEQAGTLLYSFGAEDQGIRLWALSLRFRHEGNLEERPANVVDMFDWLAASARPA